MTFSLCPSIGLADLSSLSEDQLSDISGRDSVGFIKHDYSLKSDIEMDMNALGEPFKITQYSVEKNGGGGADIGSGDDPIRFETGVAQIQGLIGLLSDVQYMETVSKPALSDKLDKQVSFELGQLSTTLSLQGVQYSDSYQRLYSSPEKGYSTNAKQEFIADEISLTLDDQGLMNMPVDEF